jgi:hypothetical protein
MATLNQKVQRKAMENGGIMEELAIFGADLSLTLNQRVHSSSLCAPTIKTDGSPLPRKRDSEAHGKPHRSSMSSVSAYETDGQVGSDDFWLIVAFVGAKMRKKIRRPTGRQFSAEEKIRIVLTGMDLDPPASDQLIARGIFSKRV